MNVKQRAGCIILLLLLLTAGAVAYRFRPADPGARFYLLVRVEDKSALEPGAPVTIGGYTVGEVEAIDLRQEAVEVRCAIRRDYQIPDDSIGRIAQVGLVGDTFVEILLGTSDRPVRQAATPGEAETLRGIALLSTDKFLNRMRAVGVKAQGMADAVTDLMADTEINTTMRELPGTSAEIAETVGALAATGEKTGRRIEAIAVQAQDVGDRIEAIRGAYQRFQDETIGRPDNQRRVAEARRDLASFVEFVGKQGPAIRSIQADLKTIQTNVEPMKGLFDGSGPVKALSDRENGLPATARRFQKAFAQVLAKGVGDKLMINKHTDRKLNRFLRGKDDLPAWRLLRAWKAFGAAMRASYGHIPVPPAEDH